MLKVKTSELTGAALDWAVAKCEGDIWGALDGELLGSAVGLNYSTNWAQGGPIIEQECFDIGSIGVNTWASISQYVDGKRVTQYGTTPLIAAMRCYVASKLGDEVEVPKEIVGA